MYYSGRKTKSCDLILVRAEAGEAEVEAEQRGFALELIEQVILVVAFEFDGDDEAPHALLAQPFQQQVDAALRGGDDVADEPIDGLLGFEFEGIALMKMQTRAAHEVISQLRAIDGDGARSTLDGDIGPTTRRSTEIDTGLAALDLLPEAEFGLDDLGEGS